MNIVRKLAWNGRTIPATSRQLRRRTANSGRTPTWVLGAFTGPV